MNTKLLSMLLNTRSFLVLLIAVLVLGSTLGVVFALGSGQSQEGGSTLSQDDLLEARRQFREQSSWGFISTGGRTGRIGQIEGSTLRVRTPKGLLIARVGQETIIRKGDEQLALDDLKPELLVTVAGEGDGEVAATEISVVPEGEGGFNIRPRSKEGPAMLPVFP